MVLGVGGWGGSPHTLKARVRGRTCMLAIWQARVQCQLWEHGGQSSSTRAQPALALQLAPHLQRDALPVHADRRRLLRREHSAAAALRGAAVRGRVTPVWERCSRRLAALAAHKLHVGHHWGGRCGAHHGAAHADQLADCVGLDLGDGEASGLAGCDGWPRSPDCQLHAATRFRCYAWGQGVRPGGGRLACSNKRGVCGFHSWDLGRPGR